MTISAGTPQLRSRQVATAERCKHKARLGYQLQARLTALQPRSVVSGETFPLLNFQLRTMRCNVAKLRTRSSKSKAIRPIRAFQKRNRMTSIVPPSYIHPQLMTTESH